MCEASPGSRRCLRGASSSFELCRPMISDGYSVIPPLSDARGNRNKGGSIRSTEGSLTSVRTRDMSVAGKRGLPNDESGAQSRSMSEDVTEFDVFGWTSNRVLVERKPSGFLTGAELGRKFLLPFSFP